MRFLKSSCLAILAVIHLVNCMPLTEHGKVPIEDPEICLNRLDLLDEDVLEFFSKVAEFCAGDLEFKNANAENTLLCDYAEFKSSQNLSADSFPNDSSKEDDPAPGDFFLVDPSPVDHSPVDSLPTDPFPADHSPVDSSSTNSSSANPSLTNASPADTQSDERILRREQRSVDSSPVVPPRSNQQPLFKIVQPVLINIYNLTQTQPALQVLKCFYSQWPPLYQATVSLGGFEYFFGPNGRGKAASGETPFGEIRSHTIWLRDENENFTQSAFDKFADRIETSFDEYYPWNFNVLSILLNSNGWANDFAVFWYENGLPRYVLTSYEKFGQSPMGQAARKLAKFFKGD